MTHSDAFSLSKDLQHFSYDLLKHGSRCVTRHTHRTMRAAMCEAEAGAEFERSR